MMDVQVNSPDQEAANYQQAWVAAELRAKRAEEALSDLIMTFRAYLNNRGEGNLYSQSLTHAEKILGL